MVGLLGLALLFLLSSTPAAASVEKARLFYDAKLLDDAKRELIETIASNAVDNEKAAALHLLGTIAVDEKNYDLTLMSWGDLIARYPTTADAREVEGKLPLVRSLVEQSAKPATADHGDPVSNATLRGVVVTGGGAETRYLEQAVDEIATYLLGRGVETSKPTNWRATLIELAPVARQSGARSILVLNIKFGYLESLRAECYLSDGTLQWEEKASGSFGVSGSGVAAGLISRIKEKLEKHVGDTCLPKKPQ